MSVFNHAWYRKLGLRSRFLVLFGLILLLSLSIVGYLGFSQASTAYREKASEVVSGLTTDATNQFIAAQKIAYDDVSYISNNMVLQSYMQQIVAGNTPNSETDGDMRNLIQQFLASYDSHYKIRVIDLKGNERLIAKRDLQSGKVSLPDDRFLRNVANDELFVRGTQLAQGDIYAIAVSPMLEYGQVVKPILPVLRFISPIFSTNGQRLGVVIHTVTAESMLASLKKLSDASKNHLFYLVNAQGEYLFHPDEKKTFAKYRNVTSNFNQDFPELLPAIQRHNRESSLFLNGHIVSTQKISPNNSKDDQSFWLIGMAEEEAALADLGQFVWLFFSTFGLVFVLAGAIIHYFVSGLLRPLTQVTHQMERLGLGETKQSDIAYTFNDEIRRLIESNQKLMHNMQQLAVQAEVIATGNFSGEVPLLSERDSLGIAINNMTRMLRHAKQEDERNNWLKDGLGQLNLALAGDLTSQQLADRAVELVGRYLSAGRGVFYRYNKEQGLLSLLGSYMFVEREALNNQFKLGEGAIGQVARECKPIILHHPSQSEPIVTGTLSVLPQHTYTYPLLRDGELLGVMEFATMEHLDELKQNFIQRACEVVASFLYIVEQHQQIKKLLYVAEEATRQAQQQAEQLQQANSLMEEQQQQLQQQAANLQSSNALLEEQQQQLQQQSEELQASNAQLEEQQQQLQQQTEELQASNAQLEEQQQQLSLQTYELERKNSELNVSRDALDQRAQELELASKYKSEFLANMSHELRTPLNSIILLSKMLAMNEDQHLSEDEVKRARIVHRSGEELLRLINDILDLSKIESGKMEVHLHAVSTQELMSEFHDLFTATAQSKNLTFQLEDQIQGEFNSDYDKLSQVLRNLLSNAFKFTKQGVISLKILPSTDEKLPLMIAVTDTGIGIPAEKQPLIFEAFQQVDGSISREYGGTGLGLTISRRYVELLGGKLTLQSEQGQGSTFCVHLPANLSTSNTPTLLTVSSHTNTPSTPDASLTLQLNDDRTNLKTSDQVILVIDDDAVFCEALMMLNRRLGYKTLVASSGEEGIRMAKTYKPRGVLLDLGLPDLDGSEVLRQLKSDRELRHLPIYIVSARDKSSVSLQHSVAGYLQKPVPEAQLASAESDVIKQAERADVLLLSGNTLDEKQLEELVPQQNWNLHSVKTLAQAIAWIDQEACQLVIIDIVRNDGDALDICRTLQQTAPDVPMILYSDLPLSEEQDAQLRGITDSIIVKAATAHQRMLENIQRFLQHMNHTGLSSSILPASTAGKQHSVLQGRHILVVDDDSRNLFVITSALEQQGASVANALSGAKGIEYLHQHRVDLVFMDIMMPEMDGYETIRRIRADAQLKEIPIVALTAKALKADRQKALDSGANDYLSKPVDYEVLVNMAKLWCDKQS